MQLSYLCSADLDRENSSVCGLDARSTLWIIYDLGPLNTSQFSIYLSIYLSSILIYITFIIIIMSIHLSITHAVYRVNYG